MSTFPRRPRDRAAGSRPAADHRHHQLRLWSATLDARGPGLDLAADPEHLLSCYRRLEADGGHAPGPDGLTYADLGPSEVACLMREVSAAVGRGDYRPGPARRVKIPKAAGGTRTLAISNITDRVVGAAVAATLTPTFEAIFLPGNYGFRPALGTWHLLADLEATLAAHRLTTLAIDDVARAFDNVPIAPLMEIFGESIADPRLLHLIEAVLRGGDDRGRALGIPQGCPLAPLALNVMLHRHHDALLQRGTGSPWFRYADNLAYACRGVAEGDQILGRVGKLLATAGLRLKGADGPPVDLRDDEAQLLGFRLRLERDRLRLRLGRGALERLVADLEMAHLEPNPPRMARAVVRGWIKSHGPAFEEGREAARTVREIVRAGNTLGFRELGSTEDLMERCTKGYRRWVDIRAMAMRTRGAGCLIT